MVSMRGVTGWTAGVVGATVAGLAVGQVTQRALQRARKAERLGGLPPDREFTVTADDGLPLAVEEIGPADGGKPRLTVVLIHGFALNRTCWHYQRRDLAQLTDPRVRLVLYDLRSHGRSGRSTPQHSTIGQLGRDLDAVLRQAAPKGPVILVGHSMGGMAIMALAQQRPELFGGRIRGVSLIATSSGGLRRSLLGLPLLTNTHPVVRGLGRLSGWQPAFVERVRGLGGPLVWSSVRSMSFGDPKVSPALVDFMAEMLAKTPVSVVMDFLHTIGEHRRTTALEPLRLCEVQVIGARRDQITPYRHSARIAEQLPDAELITVPAAGHMVMLEQPELITDSITALIRRSMKGRLWQWRT